MVRLTLVHLVNSLSPGPRTSKDQRVSGAPRQGHLHSELLQSDIRSPEEFQEGRHLSGCICTAPDLRSLACQPWQPGVQYPIHFAISKSREARWRGWLLPLLVGSFSPLSPSQAEANACHSPEPSNLSRRSTAPASRSAMRNLNAM